jgi:hypothetical protein
MHVQELWRYPVKSMAGEALEEADVLPDGLAGDRLVQVRDAAGRVITARHRPALLGHRAVIGPDGEPLVDGRPWRSPEVAADVAAAAGEGARLLRDGAGRRFDVLPLLVATDGAVAALGEDRRRLRPNILVGGVEGLAERSWEGRLLQAGGVVIRLVDLRQRCVMTTFDPDTLAQDAGILQRIHREFGGALALNASVLRPGLLRVGDPVILLEEPA